MSFVLSGAGPISASPPVKSRLSLAVIILVGAAVDTLCMVWIGFALRGYGKVSRGGKHTKVTREGFPNLQEIQVQSVV